MYRLRAIFIFMIWLLFQTHSIRGYYVEQNTERASDIKDSLVTQLLATCINIISSKASKRLEAVQVAVLCDRVGKMILRDLSFIELNLARESKETDDYFRRSEEKKEMGPVDQIENMVDKRETFYESSLPRGGKRQTSSSSLPRGGKRQTSYSSFIPRGGKRQTSSSSLPRGG